MSDFNLLDTRPNYPGSRVVKKVIKYPGTRYSALETLNKTKEKLMLRAVDLFLLAYPQAEKIKLMHPLVSWEGILLLGVQHEISHVPQVGNHWHRVDA